MLATMIDVANAHRYDGSEEAAPQIERPGRQTARTQAREFSKRAHDSVMMLLRGEATLEDLEPVEMSTVTTE